MFLFLEVAVISIKAEMSDDEEKPELEDAHVSKYMQAADITNGTHAIHSALLLLILSPLPLSNSAFLKVKI